MDRYAVSDVESTVFYINRLVRRLLVKLGDKILWAIFAIFFVLGHAQGSICFSRKTNCDLKLLSFIYDIRPLNVLVANGEVAALKLSNRNEYHINRLN